MSLFSPNNASPTVCGTTDFNGLLHTVVPAKGCTLLLCTEGCAIGSSHFRPVAIRRETLVPLFAFSRSTIERTSSRFSCRFVEMSDPAIADFTVNFNSPVFWDFLYRHPAFIIEKSAQRLAEEWFGRMEWIVRTFDGEICQQMVYSELHNLFVAIEQRVAQLFPPEVHDEKSAVWSIPLGVAETSHESLSAWPNPASGILHLDVMDGTVVSVFDMTGRMVLNECYQGQLDVSSLAPAVYAIKFEDYKVRFVKE